MAKYSFGEQETEKIKNKNGEWVEASVWQSPKYKESKDKAIEMIESKKYGLSEADFWILKNQTATGKMGYTGLIISHNGCLKINDNLDNKVNPKCFTLDKDGYNNSLVYTYIDDDTYEVGEFNSTNGKNAYPYAMAFKRCFDRVVLKKSKLAYSGIYSEVEAEEFKKQSEEEMITDAKTKFSLEEKLSKMIDEIDNENYDFLVYVCDTYKVEDLHLMSDKQFNHAIENFETLKQKYIESKVN